LPLEVETLAELRAQREPPGAIDAAAERRVQHELHAARFIEEALERDRVGGRHDAEAALRLAEVLRDLLRRRLREVVVPREEVGRWLQRVFCTRRIRAGKLEVARGAQMTDSDARLGDARRRAAQAAPQ